VRGARAGQEERMSSPQGERARIAGFDGLRGLAAASVVVLHVAYYTARPVAPWDVGDGLLLGLRLGVIMFFTLSGYLLVLPWLSAARGERRPPDPVRYLLRRLARILPAYYVALLLGAIVLVGTGNPRLPELRHVPILLALQQNWSTELQGKLVPPAWTLCVELAFYLALPLLGMAIVRWGHPLRWCAGLVAGSLAFNAAVWLWLPAQLHRTLPGNAYVFALGIGAAVLIARRAPGPRVRVALLVAGVALVMADVLANVPLDLAGRAVWRDLPAAVGFATILAAVATGPARVSGAAPLRWLGRRSYALFLVHYPVILAFTSRHALPESPGRALLLVFAISLVASELVLRCVEEPAMRLVRPSPRVRLVARRVLSLARAG
jgi:peptidoglycan/LPS O-acetylase OafA/YrhL